MAPSDASPRKIAPAKPALEQESVDSLERPESRGRYVLPEGLPRPVPEPDGLSRPYWEGAWRGELWVQRCQDCRQWQWGPEWICHACLSFEVGWERIDGRGRLYSWERVWHPVHPALAEAGPYLVVLVELPGAGNIRMIGNLVGDPRQAVRIGAPVEAVFERHADAAVPYALVQWRAMTTGRRSL